MTGRLARAVTVGASAVIVVTSPACDWFKNMADQPSVQTFERQPLAPVAGTVPVGAELPPSVSFEVANAVANPLQADEAVLTEGDSVYATYCSVCHGPAGAGDGPVVAKFIRPPTLMGASRGYSDGYIYALITNGRGNMPSYNRISPHERWAVVHYLRRLQSGGAGAAAPAPAGAAPAPSGQAPTAPAAAPAAPGAGPAASPDTGG